MRLAPSSVPLFLLRSVRLYEPCDARANAPHDRGKQARITRKCVSEWTHVNERRRVPPTRSRSKESEDWSRLKTRSPRCVMILVICRHSCLRSSVYFFFFLFLRSASICGITEIGESTLLRFTVMITHAAYSRWQSMSEIIRCAGVACTKRIVRQSRIGSNR